MIIGIPKEIKDVEIDEKQLLRIDAIITSMTKEERQNPKILNASRRQRIAKGSGNQVQDINRFIEQFTQMQKMMKMFSSTRYAAAWGSSTATGFTVARTSLRDCSRSAGCAFRNASNPL